ncbi:uncharacterized protein [Argopecten irradians]|uniref:uncharacterized protein n=1 Tax=Argopecten irradians TaxID=31199 RepID=UPI00371BE44E
MADAARVDRESKADAARIINQLKDWSSRISKISSNSKIRDEFPEEIEKTLPQTLKDQQACLQKMLDDGSFSEDVDHSYQLACNLINEIENNLRDQNVIAIPKIKEGLKRIKDHLLAFNVKKSRQALRIIKCPKDWCSCFNTWKSSQNKSEKELDNILQSLENPSASKMRVSESTYKITDMSEEIKDLLNWPEQKRRPETMSRSSGCIENEVKELKNRFEDALAIIKSTPIVDRLEGMREAMDGILKYIRGLRFNTNIFVKTKPWNSEKRGIEFPSEEIQSDKMTVESSVFDIVITRPSSSDDNCDRGVQPSISLESQMEEGYYILTNSTGKIEISCKPTVPQRLATYRFHVRHKGREGWARYTCRINDGEKAVSIDTDPFDIDAVFVTSQLDTHTIDVTTEKCTIHLDPENKDMKIVFQPNCVRSTMKVTIQNAEVFTPQLSPTSTSLL